MRKTLGEVCDFYSGTGFPEKYQGAKKGKYPFYKVGDISKHAQAGKIALDSAENYIDDDVAISIKGKIVPPNTIVFAKIGEALKLNRRAITSCDSLIDNNAIGIKPKEEYLDIEYFYFFMKKIKMQDYSESTTVPSVRKSVLEQITIDIPDKNQQREIVKVLKSVDTVINYKMDCIRLLDDLIKSRFIELFGDPVTNEKRWTRLTLGDICEIGSSKRVFEKDYVPTGVPFFRTKEIVELSKGNSISTELFISEEHFAELRKSYGTPKKDDLLISAVGTIGTIWIVSGEFEFYFKDGNIIQIKASSHFDSIFMKYLLDELIANYKKEMSTGTAYAALTIAGLKKMLVNDVPLNLQKQFATFAEQVDKSKVAVQKSLESLQCLYDKLMQDYFG